MQSELAACDISTTEAAALLGCTPIRLHQLIQNRRIDSPARNVLGHFRWRNADIEAARKAIGTDRRRRCRHCGELLAAPGKGGEHAA